MKADDVFQSRYLKASDLRGRDVTVTIDRVEMVRMPQGGQTKPAIWFRGKEKALILNKTNFNTIASVTGIEDTEDWTGQQITIYPTETEFQGQMVDCIRVRRGKTANEWQAPARPPEQPPTDYDPTDEDSIPF